MQDPRSMNGVSNFVLNGRKHKSSTDVIEAIRNEAVRKDTPDILQFASGGYYCMEGETCVIIKIDRLGNPDGAAQVEYRTIDGSAKAGVKYIPARGVAKLSPGETECEIQIELINDDSFGSVSEFRLELFNACGAILDPYLYTTEVTIADDDAFPTNKHRKQLIALRMIDIPVMSLIIEYFKMHMQDLNLRRDSIKTLFSDQFSNVTLLFRLALTKYILNLVKGTEDQLSSLFSLESLGVDVDSQVYFIMVLSVLLHPTQLVVDYMAANRRLGGKARRRLQLNLFIRFLNYAEVWRVEVSPADLVVTLTREIPELVESVFLQFFPICQKLALFFYYGFYMLQLHGLKGGIIVSSFPILMLSFLRWRMVKTERAEQLLTYEHKKFVTFAQNVSHHFRTIADYSQKQESADKLGEIITSFNHKNHIVRQRRITDRFIAPFLASVSVAVCVLSFYKQVQSSEMDIGGFIVTISICTGLGSVLESVYAHFLTVQGAVAHLHNVVHYMNLPTDLHERAKCKRYLLANLDKAQDAAANMFYYGKPSDCALVQSDTRIISGDIVEEAVYSQDLIQIDCADVTFTYPGAVGSQPRPILVNLSFEISQGQLAVVCGPRHSGKATLLQLLGGVLVPDNGLGLLFVPPHLRTLHVAHEPTIFHDLDLWDNLVYGEIAEEDRSEDRVLRICERLELNESILGDIRRQHLARKNSTFGCAMQHCGSVESIARREYAQQKHDALTKTSYSDRALINIARAFIANPDVLIIHKPLATSKAEDILHLFREFVDLRGLETSLEFRRHRRPRTCILSLDSVDDVSVADIVIEVRDQTVRTMNIETFAGSEHRILELIGSLDPNCRGSVTREAFIARAKHRKDLSYFFDISEQDSSSVSCKLGELYDQFNSYHSTSIHCGDLAKAVKRQMETHTRTQRDVIEGNWNTLAQQLASEAEHLAPEVEQLPAASGAIAFTAAKNQH